MTDQLVDIEVSNNKNNFVVKFTDKSLELDVEVSPNENTVWLTKDQMSLLFDRDRSVISRHINNIYKDGELEKNSSCAKNAHEINGQVHYIEHFNLDVIISVGYRVKSNNGVVFRKWASSILREYLIKGYVISQNRTLVTNENYINLIYEVNNLKKDIIDIKKIINSKITNSFICYEGEYYDGFTFVNSLICSAKERIIIIDGYADKSVLDFFVGSRRDIKKIILCHKVERFDVDILIRFSKQYGEINILEDKSYHDRFLIIDDDVYVLGTSLNSLGNKTSTITRTDQYDIKDILNTCELDV